MRGEGAAGFMPALFRRADKSLPPKPVDPPVVLDAHDIVKDAALGADDADLFEHQAIAWRIAELACAAEPPVNIALFGPWGSGKSSIYAPMEARIKQCDPRARVVSYDAWKYGNQSLKRHFITSVADSLDVKDPSYGVGLRESRERSTLSLWRWLWSSRWSIALGLILSLLLAAGWLYAVATAKMLTEDSLSLREALGQTVPGAGTFLGLALGALLFGPKVLESAASKVTRTAPSEDDEFAAAFTALLDEALGEKRKRRLVVFIDELDRCAPQDVVATLVSLKTFLDQPGCIFVVAADRDVLERALRDVPQAKPVRGDEPYYSTPGAFLDKIFQHQMALPPLRSYALTRFARTLVVQQAGLWQELRSARLDDRLFDEVVYALIPAHIRSPRRVKVLLNNYATTCRVAQSRGIPWLDRATELAKLAVLKTEFPGFAADLLVQPKLAAALIDDLTPEDWSVEVHRLMAKYALPADPAPGIPEDEKSSDEPTGAEEAEDEGVAGSLLTDDVRRDRRALRRADERLTRELHAYLRKTAAANIPDPRVDLLYLQGAGEAEGLDDPALGTVIDYASDTSPSEVVSHFDGRDARQIRIAARLLAERSDAEFGPGKANLAEAACRLIERLTDDEIATIAPVVGPSIQVVAQQGALRPKALPGALLTAALAGQGDLATSVNITVRKDPGRTDDVLPQLVRALPLLGEHASDLEDVIIAAYERTTEPLHLALQRLDDSLAHQLWEKAKPTVQRTVQEQSEAQWSVLDDETKAAAQQAQEATSDGPEGPDDASLVALQTYRSLLGSLDSRDGAKAELLSDALFIGQAVNVPPVQSLVRKWAEHVLPLVPDPATRNAHVTTALGVGPAEHWQWWANLLTPGVPVDAGLLDGALRGLVRAIPALPLPAAQEIPALAGQLMAVLPADGPVLASSEGPFSNEVREVLAALTWLEEDAAARRAIAYETVDRLAPIMDGSDMVAQDIASSIGQRPSDALAAEVHSVLRSAPKDAAAKVDAFLADSPSLAGYQVTILRLRLAARRRAELPALPAELVEDVSTEATGQVLVEEWLRSRPSVQEALKLMRGVATPSAEALGAYAAGLSPDDRTNLWISLEGAGLNEDLLRAVAQEGVTADAARLMRMKIEAESRQPARADLVRRLLTAPLNDPLSKSEASELVLYLLGTGYVGDAVPAADLVLHAGGAAHGYGRAIRSKFDTVVSRNRKLLGKNRREQLVAKNLLKKAGLLDRVEELMPGGD